MTSDTTYVLYEDRPSAWVGLKLAVLSLQARVPGARIVARAPHASADLQAWFAQRPGVVLNDTELVGARGWDVKPILLLEALETSALAAWMDTDIIVSGDLAGLLSGIPAETFVATEEHHWSRGQGGTHRTVAWGLEPGRSLPVTANSGFVRAHTSHVPLLEAWRDLLADPRYVEAQSRPYSQRPRHLYGDQEVLTALLAAEQFSGVDLRLLEQGKEIAQLYGASGLTAGQRLRAVATGSMPALIHSINLKPWNASPRPASDNVLKRAHATVQGLHGRLSPYTAIAARYAGELGEPAPWLGKPRGDAAALLQELPVAVVDYVGKSVKRRRLVMP